MRVIFAHELEDEQRIVIQLEGDIDLETLDTIEMFCHRQRVRICKEMKATLDASRVPTPAESR